MRIGEVVTIERYVPIVWSVTIAKVVAIADIVRIVSGLLQW